MDSAQSGVFPYPPGPSSGYTPPGPLPCASSYPLQPQHAVPFPTQYQGMEYLSHGYPYPGPGPLPHGSSFNTPLQGPYNPPPQSLQFQRYLLQEYPSQGYSGPGPVPPASWYPPPPRHECPYHWPQHPAQYHGYPQQEYLSQGYSHPGPGPLPHGSWYPPPPRHEFPYHPPPHPPHYNPSQGYPLQHRFSVLSMLGRLGEGIVIQEILQDLAPSFESDSFDL